MQRLGTGWPLWGLGCLAHVALLLPGHSTSCPHASSTPLRFVAFSGVVGPRGTVLPPAHRGLRSPRRTPIPLDTATAATCSPAEGKLGLALGLRSACNQPHTAPAAGAHQCRFRRLLEIHLLTLKGEAAIHQNNPRRRAGGAGLGFPFRGAGSTRRLTPQRGLRPAPRGQLRGRALPGLGVPECQVQGMSSSSASRPPPSPPPSSLPFQRHYKSNGLERKASKILKPSSIINADSKFPLRAFYIATVTKTCWWSCRSSRPHPSSSRRAGSPDTKPYPPGHHLGTCQALHGNEQNSLAGEMAGFLLAKGSWLLLPSPAGGSWQTPASGQGGRVPRPPGPADAATVGRVGPPNLRW